MRVDLPDKQRLIIQLDGGEELHLINTSTSVVLEHHRDQVTSYLFSMPLPATPPPADQPATPEDPTPSAATEQQDPPPPPAETQKRYATLFF